MDTLTLMTTFLNTTHVGCLDNIYLLRGGIGDWKDLGGKLENSDVLLGLGAKWAVGWKPKMENQFVQFLPMIFIKYG